jgi:hypothetical protein
MVGIMKVVRVLQAAAAGALILAASGAAAQDEGVAVKSLLGAVGIIPKDKPPIEYRERPPLVVPPKLELRPPVASGSVGARAANWPQDPDMLARREEEEDARRPAGERRADRGSRINATMTSEEIRAGTRPGAAGTVANPVQHEKNATLSPSEMARMDRRKPRNSPRPRSPIVATSRILRPATASRTRTRCAPPWSPPPRIRRSSRASAAGSAPTAKVRLPTGIGAGAVPPAAPREPVRMSHPALAPPAQLAWGENRPMCRRSAPCAEPTKAPLPCPMPPR